MLQQRSWQPGGLRAVAEELVAAFPARVPYQRFTYRDVDALGWLHRHLEAACTSPAHSLDPAGERVWGGDFIADLEAYRTGLVARAAANSAPRRSRTLCRKRSTTRRRAPAA